MEEKMAKRWLLVVDAYEGVNKNAVDMLSGYLSGLVSYTLPVRYANELSEEERKESNIIAVGRIETHSILSAYERQGLFTVPKQEEGYAVFVGKTPETDEGQTIAIVGSDEKGVLYGCIRDRVLLRDLVLKIGVGHQLFGEIPDVVLEYAVLRPEISDVLTELIVEVDIAKGIVEIPEGTHINFGTLAVLVGFLEEKHTAEVGIPVFHQLLHRIYAREAFHIDIFAVMFTKIVFAIVTENCIFKFLIIFADIFYLFL